MRLKEIQPFYQNPSSKEDGFLVRIVHRVHFFHKKKAIKKGKEILKDKKTILLDKMKKE